MFFLQISKYLELENNTTKRVKATLRYPSFVIAAIVIAVGIINAFVIPAFANFFSHYGADLPWQSQILIACSTFFINHWLELFLSFFIISICAILFLKTDNGKQVWHKYLLKIPIIGTIIKRIMFIRFSQTLALILRSGIQISEGLQLLSQAIGNRFLNKQILAMKDTIGRGENLTQAAAQTQFFSPLMLQMLGVGEETGNLDEMLTEVADFYEREVHYDLQKLNDILEPLIIVTLGIMVLILAMGVFIPMWDITKMASGG